MSDTDNDEYEKLGELCEWFEKTYVKHYHPLLRQCYIPGDKISALYLYSNVDRTGIYLYISTDYEKPGTFEIYVKSDTKINNIQSLFSCYLIVNHVYIDYMKPIIDTFMRTQVNYYPDAVKLKEREEDTKSCATCLYSWNGEECDKVECKDHSLWEKKKE